jgi:hypothetical protein
MLVVAMPTPEDLTEIENAGRRCAICRTGRHFKQFTVVRPEGQDPVVMCPACHARYADKPPVVVAAQKAKAAAAPVAAPEEKDAPKKKAPPREDRLRKTLRELPPGEYSVGRIAKAAGLNHEKALGRLHALEAAGEVQQVGKRWSNERPSTDVEAALDRLQARTSNLRIVRDREPVG